MYVWNQALTSHNAALFYIALFDPAFGKRTFDFYHSNAWFLST